MEQAFFSSLIILARVLLLGGLADLVNAQVSVAEYFDYYNQERLHFSIDY